MSACFITCLQAPSLFRYQNLVSRYYVLVKLYTKHSLSQLMLCEEVSAIIAGSIVSHTARTVVCGRKTGALFYHFSSSNMRLQIQLGLESLAQVE